LSTHHEDALDAPAPPPRLGKTISPSTEVPIEAAPAEDPRALAKRLAAEAKSRLEKAAASAAPAQEVSTKKKKSGLASKAPKPGGLSGRAPPPGRPAPAPKPAAGPAPGRVVAESADEDPRALARRLAEEAKSKLGAKSKSGAKAAAPKKKKSRARKVPAAPTPPKKRLADRAKRTMSASDALAAAMAEEAEEEKKKAPRKKSSKAAKAAAPKKAAAKKKPVAAAPAAEPVMSVPDAVTENELPTLTAMDPAELLSAILPGIQVIRTVPVTQVAVFGALWQAHRARALHEADLNLAVSASVLIDAVGRVPSGHLVGCEVTLKGTSFAAFVDTARGAVLALVETPSIYLAGL
jgi:hypothetical protein